MHALIHCQYTMPLWTCTSSSLPSSDLFLPPVCPRYTLAMHVLLLLPPCLQQISQAKAWAKVEKADVTPLILL